jgi:dipeptidyl aminopeptidase/acylaminoacyl peptidase
MLSLYRHKLQEEGMGAQMEAPYGSWKSPVTTDEVFGKFIGLEDARLDGADLYWSEYRPDGRTVILRQAPGDQEVDITPPGFNVRTRVHEYGGGDYLAADGIIYFSNFNDQRLYRQIPGEEPQPLTPTEGMRYADAALDREHERLILVREDHTTRAAQPVNSLVSVSLKGGDAGQVLVAGNDFYSTPRLSPDGKRLAWLTWNHPNLPWDGTELWVGDVTADGSIGNQTQVAGGPAESIFQPEWSPDGRLYFVSDRSGWWNLFRWREPVGEVEPLYPMEAEFGQPQWVFGMSTYGFVSPQELVCAYTRNGLSHLATLNTRSLELKPIEVPYTEIPRVCVSHGQVFLLGGSPTLPYELSRLDPVSGQVKVLRRSRPVTIDAAYFSTAQPVEFPTDGGLTAHGFFYPPHNPDFNGPPGEHPPLLVMSHGGPTGSISATLRYGIQYWTTRGFAVLDVNYGGSTGYGRAYRERLKGQWGIVDVADCVNGARYLVNQRPVDGKRLAITGGSAGGYTTLCALTFYDTFTAGASYFGISDLEVFAKDTHKFESRYLDGLVGPYPERRDLYNARSPIYYIERLSSPMILLQGLDDPIVPPNQSQMMYAAVRARGLPVAYLTFPGEQHGFVKSENNKRALEAELYFYSRVFQFELADPVEPVVIDNLSA